MSFDEIRYGGSKDDHLQRQQTSENIPQESFIEPSSSNSPPHTPTIPSFSKHIDLSSYSYTPPPTTTIKTSKPLSSHAIQILPPSKSSPSLKRKATTKSPSSSPSKKSRSLSTPAGYAPPSTYAHLPELQDVLSNNLICVFIGLNPGITTATTGHAYAHKSNLFWKLLFSSGLTPLRRLHPSEDGTLPELYQCGNTNIVSRPTRNGAELKKQELDDSVNDLVEKVRKHKPESVCIVGKSIWESIWRVRHRKAIRKEEFKYGWQDDGEKMGVNKSGKKLGEGNGDVNYPDGGWEGARVFVASSTSGIAASMSLAEKERIWNELGDWVQQRRTERGDVAGVARGVDA